MSARRFASLALVTSPLAASAYGAATLARQHPARLAADFAQPLVVVTAWGAYGTAAFAWLAGGIGACAVLLGFALARVAREPLPIDRYAIFTGAALGLLAAAAWPFVFSSDAYAYAAYGALAEHGYSPYILPPATLHDAFLDAARWQWHGPIPVDIYGPGMLAISRTAVRLGHGRGVAATLGTLRLWAGCAFIASVVGLDVALAAVAPRRRSLALAAYALNPVVIWGTAEGHNDAFVALGLAAAAAAARFGRVRAGGLLAGLLLLFKATGGALGLGYALEALRVRGGRGRSGAAATLAGLALAAAFAVPPLVAALGTVRASGRYAPAVSAGSLFGLGPALAVAAAAFLRGARHLVRGDRRGYAWFGIAALLALPNVYPWYALWIVPCTLAAAGGPAAIGLWAATISSLVRYLPDASGTLSGHAAQLAAAVALAPLTFALAEVWPHPRPKKVSAST